MADEDAVQTIETTEVTPINVFGKNSFSFSAKTTESSTSKGWGKVRQEVGIKFDSWEMAMQVVDKQFRGELAREVQRQVTAKVPDNPHGKVFLFAVAFFAAYFLFRQDDMGLPDKPVMSKGFALVLIWVCSTICGKAMGKVGMPGLLGNLLSGIILKNAIAYPGGGYDYDSVVCPGFGNVTDSGSSSDLLGEGRMLAAGGGATHPQWCINKSINGLPDEWASDIITCGLAIIFMRGGLELDLDLVKKAGAAALRLTVCPGVMEALSVMVVAKVLFSMKPILGLSLGFILAAVSPAVVVGAMFDLKKKGYGVKQNIPVLVVAAASMDDVVAISGFSIAIAFAIPSKVATTTTTVLNAIHGPLTIGVGFGMGIVCGNIAAMTQVWDKHWKRVAIVALQGFLLAFAAKHLEREWTIDGAHPIGASTGAHAPTHRPYPPALPAGPTRRPYLPRRPSSSPPPLSPPAPAASSGEEATHWRAAGWRTQGSSGRSLWQA